MRKNRAPVFLNCFSRGGSNILWNIFLSHPEFCSPIRETLSIFRLDLRAPSKEGLLLFLRAKRRLFNQWDLRERPRVKESTATYIDTVLFENKMKTFEDREMRFREPGAPYSKEEVAGSRLVAKNNNGLVFMTEVFSDIYSDSQFICLVRDPIALWESHKRRRLWNGPDEFTSFYNRVTGKMIAASRRAKNCHLMRFEDILQDPIGSAERLFGWVGAEPTSLDHFRFKSKGHFKADGTYGATGEIGGHYWVEREKVASFIEKGVNRLQRDRLEKCEANAVLQQTAASRDALGYHEEDDRFRSA